MFKSILYFISKDRYNVGIINHVRKESRIHYKNAPSHLLLNTTIKNHFLVLKSQQFPYIFSWSECAQLCCSDEAHSNAGFFFPLCLL